MPRFFDSDSNPAVLRFTENVDCPRCGERFEGEFLDYTQSQTFQDMTEPPSGDHLCPECGEQFSCVMSGWTMFGEAG